MKGHGGGMDETREPWGGDRATDARRILYREAIRAAEEQARILDTHGANVPPRGFAARLEQAERHIHELQTIVRALTRPRIPNPQD